MGCTTPRAKYDAMMTEWPGYSAETLVERWGYPADQIKSPAGNTVYVYKYRHEFYFGNTPVVQICDSFFEIDKDGIIILVARVMAARSAEAPSFRPYSSPWITARHS